MSLFYKDTKIPIYERFKNVSGIKYYQVKNYDDCRISDDEITKHLKENALSASWSGGKDSTITVELLFLDGKNPLIIYCDMGYEFDETYDYAVATIKRWQELYGATIVVLDTQYFFLDRIFTENTKGDYIGLIRGFPITLGLNFCTRDGKVRPNNYFIKSNIDMISETVESKSFSTGSLFEEPIETTTKEKTYIGDTIDIAIGYAFDEDRSVTNEDGFNFIYPLKDQKIKEYAVLQMTKDLDIYNPYYDFYFRGGCIGCPKQDLVQLIKTIKFYPCLWRKWKLIETELYRLFKISEIANPFVFTRIDSKPILKLNSDDLEKLTENEALLFKNGYAKEISCNCK